MGILSDYAPIYWGAGLPVIPIHNIHADVKSPGKQPITNGWQQFASEMPSDLLQQHWLNAYPDENIGLPLGPASGLCAIDIDTEDKKLQETIWAILPEAKWVRIGAKGMGLAYKWSGQKNFKLRGEDGGMILEFLGLGNQIIVPPSIHPKTLKPYTSNTNLWEVLGELEELDLDIEEKLRALLGRAGFAIGAGGRSGPVDIVPAGERDVQMVRHAGYLARVVLGIDRSASFSLGEAIEQMHTWTKDFTARVSGDDMDPSKGVTKLLEFLIKDLEKGRTMPEGWDANLTEDQLNDPTIKMISEKNASQRWTVVKAKDWLAGKIAEKPEDDDWCITQVEQLLEKVAADDQFTETQFRVLIPHIMRIAANLGFKKSDLLTGYRQAKKGAGTEDTWESHKTIATVVLEQMERAGEIRFDNGRFWQWNGSCFQEVDETMIYNAVTIIVQGSPLLKRHSDYKSVVEVLKKICAKKLIEVEEYGLNFANGFVGEDLKILDHDPKYGATFTLPFNYVPESADRCNRWFEFLHSVWGQEHDFVDRVALLQEAFAVTMFKLAPRYQKAFLLYGRANTGKTVILDVLRAMMPPPAVASVGPEHWGEKFVMTDLVGKAVNVVGELPESGLIAGNMFKEVIEGSVIRTEYKNVDGFTFRPLCAHWFASNYLPMSRDSSRGFIRRWMILDFLHSIEERDQIKDLALIIVSEEREEIAAWALNGLRRVLENGGFTCPISHVKRVAQMRRINNSVQAFLESSTIVGRGDGELKARDVYDQYSFHMKDVGRGMPVSYERFVQMLDDLELDVREVADLTGTKEFWVHGLITKERQSG